MPPGLRFVIYASPGMEMLVKNYGIMLRIQYKQKLSHWLSPLLEPGEDVYQLSGNDLALRLNTESHQGAHYRTG